MQLRFRRRAAATVTVLTALVTTVAGLTVASPAQAANPPTPRNFSGYGFDQCVTPSQRAMDAWLTSSPYWAVGIYIAGDSRYCGDDQQTNLTPAWVSTQLANGWRLLPITVGPQASCSVRYRDQVRISPKPADDYAAAREQGRVEARSTVRRAKRLGIVPGSTLWYDLEHTTTTDITRRCRASALTFLSAWTRTLHRLGYDSGVYSSASSWIRILDDARVAEPTYAVPDRIWIAEWVDASRYRRPPTKTPPSLLSSYVRDDGWQPGGRMRQYRGGHDERYGGVTINIDTNYLHLGRGTRPGKSPRFCSGTQVDFPRYRRLVQGSRGPQVTALQCLLRRKNLYDGRLSGVYNVRTARAVTRFQRTRGLRPGGKATRSTWTVVLAEGATPVLKIGSGGQAVRRLQRALNAAVHAELPVDGVFGPATTAAVRTYQRETGLAGNGVVAPSTWVNLGAGRM
ncbi:MAG TPA: glycoside hydrolase domain-containing protein [Nocardioidaceae bacterium]